MGRRTRRAALAWAAVAALCCACGGSDRLDRSDGELRVDRTGVDFEEAEVGALKAATVSLSHNGRVQRQVNVEIEGQGFEAPEVVYLEPAGSTELKVLFRPGAEGMATGTVRLTSHDQVIAITVFGRGMKPQPVAPAPSQVE